MQSFTLENGVSVLLRTPAWFALEVLCRVEISFYVSQFEEKTGRSGAELQFMLICFCLVAFLSAVVLLCAPLQNVISVYVHIISAVLIYASYWLSSQYLNSHHDLDYEYFQLEIFMQSDLIVIQSLAANLMKNILAHFVIGLFVSYNLNIQDRVTKFLLCGYSVPSLLVLVMFPLEYSIIVHKLTSVFLLMFAMFYLVNHIPKQIEEGWQTIKRYYTRIMQEQTSIMEILDVFSKQIELPPQLLLFWLMLFAVQFYFYLNVQDSVDEILEGTWYYILLALLATCCTTPVSLCAICVTTSYVSFVLLSLTRFYLLGPTFRFSDPLHHKGVTEGVTMFLLAVQTSLIELKSSHRAFLLSIILFIVLSSLIQSMYEVTEPVLLSLTAGFTSKQAFKHVRTVSLALFLLYFPFFMTYTLCQFFALDFWLLVIISSCLITSVQVLGSLLTYSLFMYDSMRLDSWEHLDDVVYYARGFVRCLEFLIAVCVVTYGTKESVFGEWSWINVSILFTHCYFNIWLRLQNAWKSFMLRREASKKIQFLDEANTQQLRENNDLCTICFQEMRSARITPCRHYFHGSCLKKWLYIRDACPLCHQNVLPAVHQVVQNEGEMSDSSTDASDFEEINQNGPDENRNEIANQNI